jgi:protein gp37
MQKTKIEYLTHTWNPIAMRCAPVSSGCANCWHLAMAKRLAANIDISMEKRIAYEGGSPFLDQKELEAPFSLRKPARIGVQFMGDLLHQKVDFFWFEKIMNVMNGLPRHTFFLLTKRPEKLYFNFDYPKNLWLGVSVEDQKAADERIPILRSIPATNRWVSVEPQLEQIDLCLSPGLEISADYAHRGIHWIVCGGETGSHARPLHPDWVRSVRDQCQAAGVPFFFKSWGDKGEWIQLDCGHWYEKEGSRKGHLIDGKEWKEMP